MRKSVLILLAAVVCGTGAMTPPGTLQAACRNPNLVFAPTPWIRPVAASGFVEITWFGHAFFQITSSAGTKIITDPFRFMGYPMPEVWPDVVTVSKETRNHSNVGLARGDPLVLHGLTSWGLEWNAINTYFRDVLIYNVPIHMRAAYEFIKGTAFVFELDGLCICHTGDLGEPFNEGQLELIGQVDIVLLPIGGSYTMGPESAKVVVEQLKPKIVVPMHYFPGADVLDRFLDGPHPSRFLQTNTFTVSRDTLPAATEILIPKVTWLGRDDDY